MGVTSDRNDPRLSYGVDETPRPQAEVYFVLSEEERAKGFVRPVMESYQHETCNSITTMGRAIAETYARNPGHYGATYCCVCQMHRPVGEFGEFVWVSPEHVTWEPGGELQPSDESVTAQRLKVGT